MKTEVFFVNPEEPVDYNKGSLVNVTVLIVMTTLVSTVCSVAGGVWMYLQSVESLESVVESSSKTEVGRLKDEIVNTFMEVKTASDELIDMFMSIETPVIKSPVPIVRNASTNFIEIPFNATEEWANLVRWKAWSRLTNSDVLEGIGLVLVPWEEKDPAAFVTLVWYDLMEDGSREYVHASYGQHLTAAHDISEDPWVPPKIAATSLYENNGSSDTFIYNYSFDTMYWPKKYGFPHNGDFTKYTPDTYPGDSFIRGEGRAVLTRFRPPAAWYASDNNPYVYCGYDTGYLAPPPPHPWSQYKQVWVKTYLVFEIWEDVIIEYAKQHEDTTVVIYDQTTEIVYAATTGQTMISEICWKEDRRSDKDIKECAVRIVNMSSVIQAGWRSAGFAREEPRPDSVFWKKNLDGSEHFLRQTQLFTFVPASGEPAMDIAILWLTTTRSVENKVMAALVVFITFACLVFVFDATMAVLEIFLVAIPLNRIASSMADLHTFEPDVVEENLNRITFSKCLSVKEVHAVSKGLVLACKALKEYKAFLPNTLFVVESLEVESIATTTPPLCRADSPARVSSLLQLRSSDHRTGLSLQTVKGSFAKVRFECIESGVIPDNFAMLTELVEHTSQTTKGVVHGFAPHDPLSFYVTWNVSSKCADTQVCAAQFAYYLMWSEHKGVNVSIGIANGTVQAGNLGSKTHRGFGMCGLVMDELHGVQTYACSLQRIAKTPVTVMSSVMAEVLTGRFVLESVGAMRMPDNKAHVMFCLRKPSDNAEEEWMYQLVSMKTDPLLVYFEEVARTGTLSVECKLEASTRGRLSKEQEHAFQRLLGPPDGILECFFSAVITNQQVSSN